MDAELVAQVWPFALETEEAGCAALLAKANEFLDSFSPDYS